MEDPRAIEDNAVVDPSCCCFAGGCGLGAGGTVWYATGRLHLGQAYLHCCSCLPSCLKNGLSGCNRNRLWESIRAKDKYRSYKIGSIGVAFNLNTLARDSRVSLAWTMVAPSVCRFGRTGKGLSMINYYAIARACSEHETWGGAEERTMYSPQMQSFFSVWYHQQMHLKRNA